MERVGCDYCGEPRPVKKLGSGSRDNFKSIYICDKCRKKLQNERKNIK